MGRSIERSFSINRAIRRYIDENDKKASAIADRAGIRKDVFSRIINSKRPIYADELIPIVNAVGIPLQDVIDAAVGGEEQ